MEREMGKGFLEFQTPLCERHLWSSMATCVFFSWSSSARVCWWLCRSWSFRYCSFDWPLMEWTCTVSRTASSSFYSLVSRQSLRSTGSLLLFRPFSMTMVRGVFSQLGVLLSVGTGDIDASCSSLVHASLGHKRLTLSSATFLCCRRISAI